MYFFKRFITAISLALLAGGNANAGIIDITTISFESFQDTETQLIWMDFGVNNNESYEYVISQLGAGGKYENWRLPTIDEVFTMWSNVADLDNPELNEVYPNFYGPNQFRASDVNTDGLDDSVWETVFDIIGYNHTNPIGWSFDGSALYVAYGYFEGTEGLSYVFLKTMKNSTLMDLHLLIRLVTTISRLQLWISVHLTHGGPRY